MIESGDFMRMVIQRVLNADVRIDGAVAGEIGGGYLLLLGIGEGDNEEIAVKMVDKLFRLRIFEDENGKINLSAGDVNAEILVVSQFTLYANCRKGKRPSFVEAAAPDAAERLYEYVISLCRERFVRVQSGRFGADMKVSLVNDGPFTVVLDSDDIIV